MVDATHMQKMMNQMQAEDDKMAELMGKILSGRPGYKAVIEKSRPPKKCTNCQKILDGTEKFCPDCGTKCT